MSSSTVVSLSSFNLLFFTQVLTVLTSSIKYNEYLADKGKNLTIPCSADGSIMWVKENDNSSSNSSSSTIVQTGKLLVLTNVSVTDRGLYVCFASVSPTTRRMTTTTSSNTTTTTTTTPSNSGSPDDSSQSQTPPAAALNASTTSPQMSSLPPTTPPPPLPSLTSLSTPPPLVRIVIKNSTENDSNIGTTVSTDDVDDIEEFVAVEKFNVIVRTPPGPVTQLYFKASTILGFLIWRFNKTNSGGHPVRSFTAEYRNVSKPGEPYVEHAWSRMDPINIAPNVRQMEVYKLEPNTTYEFRIWANNVLGSGDIVTTNVTTLPETNEEDLIRLIQPDLDNFDPRIWIVAVSVVLGTLVILAIGLCIVLTKECYQSAHMAVDDGWDSIELIPNIILNPGFCDGPNGSVGPPFTRTVIFGGNEDDTDSYESESDHEPRMEKFKRKVSVFFTGPTFKRNI